jgi:hypothetical protein
VVKLCKDCVHISEKIDGVFYCTRSRSTFDIDLVTGEFINTTCYQDRADGFGCGISGNYFEEDTSWNPW